MIGFIKKILGIDLSKDGSKLEQLIYLNGKYNPLNEINMILSITPFPWKFVRTISTKMPVTEKIQN